MSHPRIPPELAARALRGRIALLREKVDAVISEVLPALAEAGVRAIVLKGPAVAAWLYGDGRDRPYLDSDVLVSPADLPAAGEVLKRLGFTCVFDERDHGANPHAQMWSRANSPEVDLHWQLPGVRAKPSDAWHVLAGRTERLDVGGIEVETLDAAGRALHVAIHAAYHQRGPSHARRDLELALERLSRDVWLECAWLARRLGAEAAVGAGLRQVPGGVVLAEELRLTREGEGYWGLAGGRARPGAHGIHRVMSTGSTIGAARVLARELFPPPSYMRAVSPTRGLAPVLLIAAYVRRLFRGLRNAPGAIRTARRTRRLERGTWQAYR